MGNRRVPTNSLNHAINLSIVLSLSADLSLYSERFMKFNNEVIAFVEKCSDESWAKVCSGEKWPVSVVARHIAAGHYSAFGLAKMIVNGKQLPELTQETID